MTVKARKYEFFLKKSCNCFVTKLLLKYRHTLEKKFPEVTVMDKNENGKAPLKDELMDKVSGGAWTGNETELTMVCAGCRDIRVFRKDEWGYWRCEACNGTETMSYFDL